MDIDFYTEENRVPNDKWINSPSNKYKLWVRYYRTKEGCWNYSRGTVYKIDDAGLDKPICDIKRNYSTFHYSFIIKDNEEWLITGRSYMGQTLVCLDTGEEFNHDDTFCWASAFLSPDETTLVVNGCYWAAPYEYKLYDFTNPRKGWPLLDSPEIYDDEISPVFHDNGVLEVTTSRKFFFPLNKFDDEILDELDDPEIAKLYDDDNNMTDITCTRTLLKRENDKFIIVEAWISDEEKVRLEKRRRAFEEYNKWLNTYRSSNEMYLMQLELIERMNLCNDLDWQDYCYKDWDPDCKHGEKRFCKRIVSNRNGNRRCSADLEWSVDTEIVKLRIYNDNDCQLKTFGRGTEAMKAALSYAKDLNEASRDG